MIGQFAIYTETVQSTAPVAPLRFVTKAGAYPAAGAGALGVTRTGGAVGELMPVDAAGSTIVEAGGAFPVDAALMVDAVGRVVLATGVNKVVGRALGAAAALGDQIEVFLVPNAS